MNWNDHGKLKGQHAFLGASKYSWINYDKDRLFQAFANYEAVKVGTKLHEVAAHLIEIPLKIPKSHMALKFLITYELGYKEEVRDEVLDTLTAYVNDSIGFHMSPEQVLYYSENCFGTTDAISFRDNCLRIHDLKTGEIPAHMEQLEIYAALFCLEYNKRPGDIQIELRLYQSGDVLVFNPTADDILPIMDKIVMFDKYLSTMRVEEI
jgi:hypothetical protein